MEGLDASDGAGTGTEIDEVRGGVWADHGTAFEPGRGGGGAGRVGTDLPALARSLRGGGCGGSLRPPPGPGLGPARAARRGVAGAGAVRHPLLGLHRQALPREAGRRARLRAQLQLGAAELAGTWAHAGCAPARRAPAQASAPCASRHDGAPGRLAPRVGAGPLVGPDRDHGRRHQRDLLGLLRRRRGHDVELPGAFRGDPGARAVLLALRRPGQPLLAHARGRRHGRQGQADPGRPCASAARHRAHRGLFARGQGALRAHVRDLAEALAPGTQARRHHRRPRPTASSRRSTCRSTTPASRPRPRTRAPPSSPSQARSTTSSACSRSAPSATTTPCATAG